MSELMSMPDVVFDFSIADEFAGLCDSSAARIEALHSSRVVWAHSAKADFSGYFACLFDQNGVNEGVDALNVAACLRDVAAKVRVLRDAACEENAVRRRAREWQESQEREWAIKGFVDDFMGWDACPTVPRPRGPVSCPSAPELRARENPVLGGGSESGVSSARPECLRSYASSMSGADDELDIVSGRLEASYQAFVGSCLWGRVDASSVLDGVRGYVAANRGDAVWARTIASAFEAAGSVGGVSTLSDPALFAALAAAGVSATRLQVAIESAQLQGGVPSSGFADDPVNVATGNFVEPEADLVFFGGSSALGWSRMYNSASHEVLSLGPGWVCPADECVDVDGEAARWRMADGRVVVFPREGEGFARSLGESFWLVAEAGAGWVVSDSRGGVWRFDVSGRVTGRSAGAGTGVSYLYEDGRLACIRHERGRFVDVIWDEVGERIVGVEACDGRVVSYSYDGSGRLVGVVGCDQGRRVYEWDEVLGVVVRVVDADGVVVVDNTYDEAGRIGAQRSPAGRVSRYSYLPGGVTQVADEDGTRANVWVSDPLGRLIAVTDSSGNTQRQCFDRWGNQVMVRDRAGGVTVREFDERGRCVAEVNPVGVRTDYCWDESDRLTRVSVDAPDTGGPSVTLFEYTADERFPSVIVDAEGAVTRAAWMGDLLTELVDPTGRTTHLSYDAFGDLVSVTNGAGETARLVRDDAGRIVASVSPAGRRTRFVYDSRGLCTSRIDPAGNVWAFEYTPAGRLSARVDPVGGRVEVVHDEAGQDGVTVDELGRRIVKTFDDLGNVARVELPDGSAWEFIHDSMSRMTRVSDPAGGSWSVTYDPMGHPTQGVDPVGVGRVAALDAAGFGETISDGKATWSECHDLLGRLIASAGPDGREVVWRVDRMGRVVATIDPEGNETRYERDAAGRVTRVRLADGASYSYEYDRAGRWWASTSTGGARFEIVYDADGNIVRETWPTAEEVLTDYDVCARPVRRVQPGVGTTTLSYDACGRVTRMRTPRRRWGRLPDRRLVPRWCSSHRSILIEDRCGRQSRNPPGRHRTVVLQETMRLVLRQLTPRRGSHVPPAKVNNLYTWLSMSFRATSS